MMSDITAREIRCFDASVRDDNRIPAGLLDGDGDIDRTLLSPANFQFRDDL
jgi:hypothetical protein